MTIKTQIPDYKLDPPIKKEYKECPLCGTTLYDYIVLDIWNDVVGCSECTRNITAEEFLEDCDED